MTAPHRSLWQQRSAGLEPIGVVQVKPAALQNGTGNLAVCPRKARLASTRSFIEIDVKLREQRANEGWLPTLGLTRPTICAESDSIDLNAHFPYSAIGGTKPTASVVPFLEKLHFPRRLAPRPRVKYGCSRGDLVPTLRTNSLVAPPGRSSNDSPWAEATS